MRLFDSGKQPSRPAPKRQVSSKQQPKRTPRMVTPRDTASHVDAITLTMHIAKRDHVVHVANGSKSHEEFAKMLQTLLKHGAMAGDGPFERPAPRYSIGGIGKGSYDAAGRSRYYRNRMFAPGSYTRTVDKSKIRNA
jgi:hypothetical protein